MPKGRWKSNARHHIENALVLGNMPITKISLAWASVFCSWKAEYRIWWYYLNALAGVIIAMTKASQRENSLFSLWKDLFSLLFSITVHYQRKSKKELKHDGEPESRAEAEALEEYCLLGWSPWLVQPAFFFFSNHSYQPRGIPIRSNLGPSTSITMVLCVYIMASNFVLFMGFLSV